MSILLQDLRYALRALRHNPAFTTVVVITLALGIGANTAIFSVVDAVLLKPLPYPHADRLVSLDTKVPGPGKDIFGSAMSYPDIQQLQALTKDFAGVAAYTYARYNYAGSGQASELAATVVSPNLFGVLGVSPAIGRGFTGAELHDQLAVLSYGLWATAFGSDRNIVGRVINLDGQSFTVVGVMPRGFAFPNEDTQLWVPLGEALRSHPQLEFNRQLYAFESVARLAAGATLARARADAGVVAQRIGAAERAFLVDPLKVEGVENVRSALLVLFGAVGLVLLIACANAAGLYVARATERRKEIAVRRALGADRARLVRQLLTESVVVALIAGAALVLLVGSGLLITTFVRLTSVDPGYDTHDVLAVRIRLTPSRYADPTVQNQFFQNLTDLLARNPGVADVSVARLPLPLAGGVNILAFDPRRIRPDATEEFLAARLSVVGPGYFAAMGIPLRGRDFTPQDRADAPRVVIMNRRLSDELWPGQDPVGKVFPVRRPGGGDGYDATVIGTIGDIRYESLDATPMRELYFPQLQAPRPPGVPEMWVVLKAKHSPLALVGAVRDAVRQV